MARGLTNCPLMGEWSLRAVTCMRCSTLQTTPSQAQGTQHLTCSYLFVIIQCCARGRYLMTVPCSCLLPQSGIPSAALLLALPAALPLIQAVIMIQAIMQAIIQAIINSADALMSSQSCIHRLSGVGYSAHLPRLAFKKSSHSSCLCCTKADTYSTW